MDFYGLLPFFDQKFQNLIKNDEQSDNRNFITECSKVGNLKNILYNFGANHSLI